MANLFTQLSTLTPVNEPPVCPPAGMTYIYQWSEDTKKDDWRADGYHRRQNGPHRAVKCTAGEMQRIIFDVSFFVYILEAM